MKQIGDFCTLMLDYAYLVTFKFVSTIFAFVRSLSFTLFSSIPKELMQVENEMPQSNKP